MSNVTNLLILTPLSLCLELERVNALISTSTGGQRLAEVDDRAGGNKRMEHNVWAAAFNGIDREAFFEAMHTWALELGERAELAERTGLPSYAGARAGARAVLEGADVLIIGQEDTSASLYRFNHANRRLELVHPGWRE